MSLDRLFPTNRLTGISSYASISCLIACSSVFGQSALTSSSNAAPPITGEQRLEWVTLSTVGPASLAGGVISAGFGTWINSPREYGTHWEGFGDRYGIRLTGIATSNVMEAGLGALWGEDPRYERAIRAGFGGRVGHVLKMAFLARNRNGRLEPAYARFIANSGSNYLSNTWRADSEATWSKGTLRIGLGFAGRIAGNAFSEFWPDVSNALFHRGNRSDPARSSGRP